MEPNCSIMHVVVSLRNPSLCSTHFNEQPVILSYIYGPCMRETKNCKCMTNTVQYITMRTENYEKTQEYYLATTSHKIRFE